MRKIFKYKCKNCNIEFESSTYYRLFCSNSCSAIFNNKQRSSELYANIGKKISETHIKFYKSKKGIQLKKKLSKLYKGKTSEEILGKEKALIKKQRQSKSLSGKNNPMYGKSIYNTWIKKYGKIIADEKLKELKEKLSLKNTGKNNPMYGKPSPMGSGNGWSGWYRGYYFRSLLELSYLKYLLDNNIKFKSAENKKYMIKYYDSYKNVQRNYFPDYYLLDTEEIIEVKPKKLIKTKANKDKFNNAKKIYKNKFKIITENDVKKLSFNEIKALYINNEIKFLKKYEEKFKKWMIDEKL